jgi:hypothetical protein
MNASVDRTSEPVVPLSGIRVLESGAFMAAPFGTSTRNASRRISACVRAVF